MPLGERITTYSDVVPDLVVEIVSPSDDLSDVLGKAQMWLSFGVRLVWVVDPDSRSVYLHHGDRAREVIAEDGYLDGLDVLPGFACALSTIFGS